MNLYLYMGAVLHKVPVTIRHVLKHSRAIRPMLYTSYGAMPPPSWYVHVSQTSLFYNVPRYVMP